VKNALRATTPAGAAWNRRQILKTLAGVAGLPVPDSFGARKRSVGIIGGGMAGVSLAWLLDGRCDVVLLESEPQLGGNIRSVKLQLDGQPFVVDVGAQYFHPALYPTYWKVLTLFELRRDVHSFTASITLAVPGEMTPRFVSPIFPGRAWPLIAPWNLSGLEAFAVAFASAKKREVQNADWDVTMESWLQSLELTPQQRDGMVLPWAASLFSGDVAQARGLSARAAMLYAAKTLPENPTEPFIYYVLKTGLAEVLRRMIARCSTVSVITQARVSAVARNAEGGFVIQDANGGAHSVDHVVFASSGPSTLDLIRGLSGTGAQQTALEHIEFHDTRIAIHTDAVYSGTNRQYWSFFNDQFQNGYCEASMWLADVLAQLSPSTAAKLWKSWITHRPQAPAQALALAQFRHVLPTPATLHAQRDLLAMQGQGRTWFVGGYLWPYDSQETALVSAIDVAQRLLAFPG